LLALWPWSCQSEGEGELAWLPARPSQRIARSSPGRNGWPADNGGPAQLDSALSLPSARRPPLAARRSLLAAAAS